MKSLTKSFTALFVILLMASGINFAAPSIEFGDAFTGLFGLSLGYTILKHSMERAGHSLMPTGAFAAVVLLELWEQELITNYEFLNREWLNTIANKDQYVGNNVIHLHQIGADPDVLINNTTYPITVAGRVDDETPLSLFKYDTTNTEVTDDEINALPYDKKGSVVERHRIKLETEAAKHGLHQLAPASESVTGAPVLRTTGATVNSRKRLTYEDLSNYALLLSELEIPLEDRQMVLCPEHANDLRLEDQTFRDRFNSTATGKLITQIAGFNIFEDVYCPKFATGGAKKAYGASPLSTDRNASVFFQKDNAIRAKGTVKAYYLPAEMNPTDRKSIFGYRLYNLIINKQVKGTGAIVSAVV